MTYASIPLFGEMKRLYREVQMAYMVSRKMQLDNHPIYVVDTELGSQIFFNNCCFEGETLVANETDIQQEQVKISLGEVWKLSFDGSTCEKGSRASVWIFPPNCISQFQSFKLLFDCTNNIIEYEALVTGLNLLREQMAQKFHIF